MGQKIYLAISRVALLEHFFQDCFLRLASETISQASFVKQLIQLTMGK